jgi:hypothetical protein
LAGKTRRERSKITLGNSRKTSKKEKKKKWSKLERLKKLIFFFRRRKRRTRWKQLQSIHPDLGAWFVRLGTRLL